MPRKLVSFDWAMKKILRQKANFEILEGFLSELFKFDVLIQEILESEANQESDDDKFNRVDLLAKNEKGELILIEVQHNSEIDYFHRMVYGTSKLISEYMEKGKGYTQVKKVYSVNIVYFHLGQGRDYIYYGKTDFKGLNNPNDILLPSQRQKDDFKIENIYEIYPEYYILKINDFNDISKNSLDEWIYFLKNEEIKDNFKAKGLEKAKESLDLMKLDDKAKALYKRSEDNKRDKESIILTAKREGKREGLKEGEKLKELEIAKNLLDVGVAIDIISQTTNLNIDEIKSLIKT